MEGFRSLRQPLTSAEVKSSEEATSTCKHTYAKHTLLPFVDTHVKLESCPRDLTAFKLYHGDPAASPRHLT